MRTAPKKNKDEEALYAAALRALMRRSYSVFQMRTYLEKRSEEQAMARRVVSRLREERLIDDARFAMEFARSRAQMRRQGRYRVARELRSRGVPDEHITTAIDQVYEETDETVLVRKVIERRLRTARGPMDDKKMASLYRTLLRAGFDSQRIRTELRKALDDTAAADLPEVSAEENDA